jgi:hypothetical protein
MKRRRKTVTPYTALQASLVLREDSTNKYEQIRRQIVSAPVVGADETGVHVNGKMQELEPKEPWPKEMMKLLMPMPLYIKERSNYLHPSMALCISKPQLYIYLSHNCLHI